MRNERFLGLGSIVLATAAAFSGCDRGSDPPVKNMTSEDNVSFERLISNQYGVDVYKMVDKTDGQVCYIVKPTFSSASISCPK